MHYRKVWENKFGKIPTDENGFKYEIHHIDGNRKNNSIENLQCITILEHLQIHINRGDWGSVALIGKRIGLGPKYMSEVQRGVKRPGVGGAKKGRTPWNKNKKGCFSKETIDKFKTSRKGRRFSPLKISDSDCQKIISLYANKPNMCGAGKKSKNGRIMSYETAFSNCISKEYGVTPKQIYNIITGKRNVL